MERDRSYRPVRVKPVTVRTSRPDVGPAEQVVAPICPRPGGLFAVYGDATVRNNTWSVSLQLVCGV